MLSDTCVRKVIAWVTLTHLNFRLCRENYLSKIDEPNGSSANERGKIRTLIRYFAFSKKSVDVRRRLLDKNFLKEQCGPQNRSPTTLFHICGEMAAGEAPPHID